MGDLNAAHIVLRQYARELSVNYSSTICAYAIKILMIYSSLDYRANHQKLEIVRIALLSIVDDISIGGEVNSICSAASPRAIRCVSLKITV